MNVERNVVKNHFELGSFLTKTWRWSSKQEVAKSHISTGSFCLMSIFCRTSARDLVLFRGTYACYFFDVVIFLHFILWLMQGEQIPLCQADGGLRGGRTCRQRKWRVLALLQRLSKISLHSQVQIFVSGYVSPTTLHPISWLHSQWMETCLIKTRMLL